MPRDEQFLNDVISNSPVSVLPGRYAIAQVSGQIHGTHFMVTHDDLETTVITEEHRLTELTVEASEIGYKLILLAVSEPLQAIGFLAKVTGSIAAQSIYQLVVSTYSRDYIMVREPDLENALKALEAVGFTLI